VYCALDREVAVATKADVLIRHHAEANAALIAAAPEIFEALVSIVGHAAPHFTTERQKLALARARAAIAKAEGWS
jgi:hypothetical protein